MYNLLHEPPACYTRELLIAAMSDAAPQDVPTPASDADNKSNRTRI